MSKPSIIKLGGKMTFVGANRRMSPIFSVWWDGLLKALGDTDHPLPNIEAAHKAYMSGASIGTYAGEVQRLRDLHKVACKATGYNDVECTCDEAVDGSSWYVKDVIKRVKDISAHRLVQHRQQNEISLGCGVGSAVRTRIAKENEAISNELARRRQLDADSLLREEASRRQLDQQQRSRHTCVKQGTSRGCHACNTGVPYPHESEDDRLVTSRKALVEKITDAVRRIDRELAVVRQDLDRLRSFD